jgi:aconitate hydratase 2/2-methylisocitrate dehydratase
MKRMSTAFLDERPGPHLGPLMRVITVLEAYRKHIEERAALGIVPQPLNAEQTAGLVELLKNPPAGEEAFLVDLITNRVPPGWTKPPTSRPVSCPPAKGEATSDRQKRAVELLGTMQGGYNIVTLVNLLDDAELAPVAAEELKHTLLMFDAFHDVAEKAKNGNVHAKAVMQSWADGEWFKKRPCWPTRSACACSRSPAKPTPTTCPLPRTPGPVQTSRCTPWPC